MNDIDSKGNQFMFTDAQKRDSHGWAAGRGSLLGTPSRMMLAPSAGMFNCLAGCASNALTGTKWGVLLLEVLLVYLLIMTK